MLALTRCAAKDVAAHGIRVNAVAPSRAAEPWEVATVMVFLGSDHASYLTGEVIAVSSQHP